MLNVLFPMMLVSILCITPIETSITSNISSYNEMVENTNPEFTEYEIQLMANVVYAEARGEDETGKRLVAATILNRLDRVDIFGYKNIEEVVTAPCQFYSIGYSNPECVDAVKAEISERSNTEVLWFCSTGYHSYGEKLFSHGGHYFNGYRKDDM